MLDGMKATGTLLLVLLLAGGPAAAAKKVYRTVGPDGVVEFTDRPPDESATEVEVPPPNTYTPPPLPGLDTGAAGGSGAGFRYRRLEIVAPRQDQTFADNTGNVTVRIVLEPPLETRLGHRLELVVDGTPRPAGPATTLTNLPRGEHTVQARVLDRAGQVIRQSPVVRFHVRRISVLGPDAGVPPEAQPQPGNGTVPGQVPGAAQPQAPSGGVLPGQVPPQAVPPAP